MADESIPSPEELRQLIDYDPETGRLLWRERHSSMFKDMHNGAERSAKIWNSRYAGKDALAWANTNGHLCGDLKRPSGRVKIYAHRAAWAIHYGVWPSVIDHINGDPADNRIDNLRSTTQHENAKNQKKRSTNSSGITGVRFYAPRGKWTASITHNRKNHHLGYFKTAEEAAQARSAAEARFGFSDRHGL